MKHGNRINHYSGTYWKRVKIFRNSLINSQDTADVARYISEDSRNGEEASKMYKTDLDHKARIL